ARGVFSPVVAGLAQRVELVQGGQVLSLVGGAGVGGEQEHHAAVLALHPLARHVVGRLVFLVALRALDGYGHVRLPRGAPPRRRPRSPNEERSPNHCRQSDRIGQDASRRRLKTVTDGHRLAFAPLLDAPAARRLRPVWPNSCGGGLIPCYIPTARSISSNDAIPWAANWKPLRSSFS